MAVFCCRIILQKFTLLRCLSQYLQNNYILGRRFPLFSGSFQFFQELLYYCCRLPNCFFTHSSAQFGGFSTNELSMRQTLLFMLTTSRRLRVLQNSSKQPLPPPELHDCILCMVVRIVYVHMKRIKYSYSFTCAHTYIHIYIDMYRPKGEQHPHISTTNPQIGIDIVHAASK